MQTTGVFNTVEEAEAFRDWIRELGGQCSEVQIDPDPSGYGILVQYSVPEGGEEDRDVA